MPILIDRRHFLAAATLSAAAALVRIPASADTSLPAAQTSPGSSAGGLGTAEGLALTAAALATLGYPLSPERQNEVRSQLVDYPGVFATARSYVLLNSDSPTMALCPPLPRSGRV